MFNFLKVTHWRILNCPLPFRLHGEVSTLAPKDPVAFFKLPRFGENGYIKWTIQRGRGNYVEKRIEVEQLIFRIFNDSIPPELNTTIKSPYAIIIPDEERAYSQEPLKFQGLISN